VLTPIFQQASGRRRAKTVPHYTQLSPQINHNLAEWQRYGLSHNQLFWDAQQGGYFDATASDLALLARTREAEDNAEPSPNSTAAMNLLRLAQITGRTEWEDKARKTFAAFASRLASRPQMIPAMASALDFDLARTRQIVIAGNRSGGDTRELLLLVNQRFLPNAILLLADGAAGQAQLARWRSYIADMHPLKGQATIYICENFVCKLPTADLTVAAKLLDSKPEKTQ